MERLTAEQIGKAVRYHRRCGGLSQRDLADLAGVGKTSVFDIEKGKPTIRLATLVAVLRVLECATAHSVCCAVQPGKQSKSQCQKVFCL